MNILFKNLRNLTVRFNFSFNRKSLLTGSRLKTTCGKQPVAVANENQIGSRMDENYKCIYHFSLINHLRIFNRLKIYQTITSVVYAISSLLLFQFEIIDDSILLIGTNAAMIFAIFMFYIISRQSVRVVGRLYLSQDGKNVKIAHLNVLGRRKEFEIKVDDITPLSHIGELEDTFLSLKVNSMDGSMFIVRPFGRILDQENFLKIFGIK
jgi:hypothetical protein